MRSLLQAEKWMQEGKEVAIATVISTFKASPNRVGSQLIFNDIGEFFGAVSGGCIENQVFLDAQNVIVSGDPKRLEFEVHDTIAIANGLACGGRIDLYLERIG